MSTTKEVAAKPIKRISLRDSFEDKNFVIGVTVDFSEKAIQLNLEVTYFSIMGRILETFKYGFFPDGTAELNFKRDGLKDNSFNSASLKAKVKNGEVAFKELITFLSDVNLQTPSRSISDAASKLLEAVDEQLKVHENSRYVVEAEQGVLSPGHVRWIIEKSRMDSVGNLDAVPFLEHLDSKASILRKETE